MYGAMENALYYVYRTYITDLFHGESSRFKPVDVILQHSDDSWLSQKHSA